MAGENVNLGNTHTAFSPDVIVNNILTFTYNGFNVSVQSQYVGEQYLTNTDFKNMICHDENGNETIETLMLKDHFTTNVDLSYNFSLKKFGIKSANVGVTRSQRRRTVRSSLSTTGAHATRKLQASHPRLRLTGWLI